MLHTKFHDNQSTVSSEDFLKGFGCHIDHVTKLISGHFHYKLKKQNMNIQV